MLISISMVIVLVSQLVIISKGQGIVQFGVFVDGVQLFLLVMCIIIGGSVFMCMVGCGICVVVSVSGISYYSSGIVLVLQVCCSNWCRLSINVIVSVNIQIICVVWFIYVEVMVLRVFIIEFFEQLVQFGDVFF